VTAGDESTASDDAAREVPISGLGHPLADRVGSAPDGTGWTAVETRSRVVWFNPGRANLLAMAVEGGRRPVLISDEQSLLTTGFAWIWREGGGSWVVREAAGGLRNGFDGRRVDEIPDAWTLPPPSAVEEMAVNYLRPVPAETLQISVTVALRHRAGRSPVLGGPVAALSESLLGRPPRSWGPHEPVGRPWDRAQLTDLVRQEMPNEATVFVAGDGLTATVSAQRTDHGVEEITRIVLATGSPDLAELAEIRSRLSDVLASLAATAMPLIGLVLARPGRRDLLVPPFLQAASVPLMLLVGAPAVRSFGLDVAGLRDRYGAQVVGRPRIPALLVDLGSEGTQAWQRLDEVLSAFDRERLDEALGMSTDALAAARAEQPARWSTSSGELPGQETSEDGPRAT
jgi:hypothetical protein